MAAKVTFICYAEDHKLTEKVTVDESLLKTKSHVFEVMLHKRNSALLHRANVKVTDIPASVFKYMTKWMANKNAPLPRLSIDHEVLLLYAANKYCIEELAERCNERLLPRIFLPLEEYLMIYDKLVFVGEGNTELGLKYLDIIDQHLPEVVLNNTQFLYLRNDSVSYIIMRDTFAAKEISIYRALVRWSQFECECVGLPLTEENQQHVVKNMINHVRFSLIPNSDLKLIFDECKLLPRESMLYALSFCQSKSTSLQFNQQERIWTQIYINSETPYFYDLHRGCSDVETTVPENRNEKVECLMCRGDENFSRLLFKYEPTTHRLFSFNPVTGATTFIVTYKSIKPNTVQFFIGIGQKLFIFCNGIFSLSYDVKTKRSQRISPLPIQFFNILKCDANTIYALRSPVAPKLIIWKYEVNGDRWTKLIRTTHPPHMNIRNVSAIVHNNTLIMAGGQDLTGRLSPQCLMLNITQPNSLWQIMPPMNIARTGFSFMQHRHYLIAIGGFDNKLRPLTTVEVLYNNMWSTSAFKIRPGNMKGAYSICCSGKDDQWVKTAPNAWMIFAMFALAFILFHVLIV